MVRPIAVQCATKTSSGGGGGGGGGAAALNASGNDGRAVGRAVIVGASERARARRAIFTFTQRRRRELRTLRYKTKMPELQFQFNSLLSAPYL